VAVYRDTAVVLRVTKLGEADRIVTLLTRRHGRIRAVAKGVRRTKSRFGGRLEPFGHVDVQLFAGRSLDVVTQAETVDPFGARIVGDYARYTAATAVAETTERLSAEDREPWLRMYLLVVSALRALAEPVPAPIVDGYGGAQSGGWGNAAGNSAGNEPARVPADASGRERQGAPGERLGGGPDRRHFRDPSLVLDAFLLRALALAGWAAALRECARCSAPGTHSAFHVPAGGVLCSACRGSGCVRPAAATVQLMGALESGDWTVAEASAPEHRREASSLVSALVQFHLERGLKSLPLVDRNGRMTASAADRVPT
jgi:DNA repair protein RecO (recombination protein O)